MPSLKSRLNRLLPILCLSGLLLSTACATTKIIPTPPAHIAAGLSEETRAPCTRPQRPTLTPGLFDAARGYLKDRDFDAASTAVTKIETNMNGLLAFSISQEATINCEADKKTVAVQAHDVVNGEAARLRGRLRD